MRFRRNAQASLAVLAAAAWEAHILARRPPALRCVSQYSAVRSYIAYPPVALSGSSGACDRCPMIACVDGEAAASLRSRPLEPKRRRVLIDRLLGLIQASLGKSAATGNPDRPAIWNSI